MRGEADDECGWYWQGRHHLSRVVLELVFTWLKGVELARAGAVCRLWRQVAAEPVFWRLLFATHARLSRSAQLAWLDIGGEVQWRQLYVDSVAGWELVGHLEPPVVGFLHASLSPDGERLALVAADATVAIWERSGGGAAGAWGETCSLNLQARGWTVAERSEWARDGTRLLVAGRRALLDRDAWELLVLAAPAPREGAQWSVGARARASGGAAGCWADAAGEAFLSLELRLLAPGLSATTVWLNAATQEMHSEYAGVVSPLLRIFNEDGHLLSALVAEVPGKEGGDSTSGEEEAYVRATRSARGHVQIRVLVAAWGRGRCGAMGAWVLTERRPPPLFAAAGGDLRTRMRRRAEARDAPPPDRDPTEAEVRALCTPPDAVCRLPAPPSGIAVHPNGRCVWACWPGGGGACLSLPTLTPLRVLGPAGPVGDPVAAVDHYVQPTASYTFFAAPVGGMGGAVRVWGTGGDPASLAHRGPALAALLSPPRGFSSEPETILVLTPDHVHVWRNRSTLQPRLE